MVMELSAWTRVMPELKPSRACAVACLRAALSGAFGALACAEVARADGDGCAAGSVAEESVAGDGGDHGDGGVGVVGDVERVGDAAGPAGLGGSALCGVLPLELLVGVREEIGGQVLAGQVLARGGGLDERADVGDDGGCVAVEERLDVGEVGIESEVG